MRNKFLLLLLVAVSLGLKAQTDMFPDYTPESYDIALDYKAEEIKMFNIHDPNNICNSYMYYNVYGLKPIVGNREKCLKPTVGKTMWDIRCHKHLVFD